MLPCAPKNATNVACCVALALVLLGFSATAAFLSPHRANEWILFAVQLSLNVRLLLKCAGATRRCAPNGVTGYQLVANSPTESFECFKSGALAASWRRGVKSVAHVSAHAGVLAAVVATSAEPAAARAWPFVLASAAVAETA